VNREVENKSTPANGATVAEPVSEILIEFTNPSTEAGDGFVVLDPNGQIREPSTVTTDDGRVFRLGFEPALAGGQVGVRWSVRAGDAHPIEGSFAFTVGDAATASVTDDTSSMSAEEMTAIGSDDMSSMSPEGMASMDEFLQVDQSTPGESLARLGPRNSLRNIIGSALEI